MLQNSVMCCIMLLRLFSQLSNIEYNNNFNFIRYGKIYIMEKLAKLYRMRFSPLQSTTCIVIV